MVDILNDERETNKCMATDITYSLYEQDKTAPKFHFEKNLHVNGVKCIRFDFFGGMHCALMPLIALNSHIDNICSSAQNLP